ncbi:helix-turn-helix domain-containing protein [Leminorella richardii]|nr:helix-turn-helix domain-containing protein [Leminorella richardii]
MNIVAGGYFEHRLLSSSQLSLYHQKVMMKGASLETSNYSFPVIVRGRMPFNRLCIGFMAYGSEAARYNTVPLAYDEVQIYPEGCELLYHTSGPTRWVVYSVERDVLQQAAIAYSGKPLPLSQDRIVSLYVGKSALDELIGLTDKYFTAIQDQDSGSEAHTREASAFHTLNNRLFNHYVSMLCRQVVLSGEEKKSAISQRHNNLIGDSERLVMAREFASIKLINIAERTGYSLRALELIFRHSVGMPPGKWFLNLRLNGALRDLLNASTDGSVSSIATRWGFQHLSRFSEQYRKTFGEYPSHTLARNQHRDRDVRAIDK